MKHAKLFAALALVSLLVAPVLAAQNGSSHGREYRIRTASGMEAAGTASARPT